ncbi:MAG: hypothetical protein WB609_08390 [Candidatus Cybelea sp.]
MLLLSAFASPVAAVAAPADRYFGRFKMSALRIRYETMQLKKRYETHQLFPDQTMHLLLLTEDAFQEWARLYSHDPWLPSTGYAMAQLYEELPGTAARDHAVTLLIYVKSHSPTTSYGAKSRAALHRGLSVKPMPAWAEPPPTAPPSAAPSAPVPTPSGAPSPSATPSQGVRPQAQISAAAGSP